MNTNLAYFKTYPLSWPPPSKQIKFNKRLGKVMTDILKTFQWLRNKVLYQQSTSAKVQMIRIRIYNQGDHLICCGNQNIRIANSGIANSSIVNSRIANSRIANTRIVNSRIVNCRIVNSRIANTRIVNSRIVNSRIANYRKAITDLMLCGNFTT
jgi:PPE-repeat protein